jgi:hypothetical protein
LGKVKKSIIKKRKPHRQERLSFTNLKKIQDPFYKPTAGASKDEAK